MKIRPRRIVVASAAASVALLGSSAVAPAAHASNYDRNYFLGQQDFDYNKTRCEPIANPGGWPPTKASYFIRSLKDAARNPPAIWRAKTTTTNDGNFKTDITVEDGFSSVYRDVWCNNGLRVVNFYGNAKVSRTIYVNYTCAGGGCRWNYTKTTKWVSNNWS